MNTIRYERSAISPGDCIGGGWAVVTRRFWMYVGVCLLMMIFLGCIPFAGFFLLGPVLGGFYYLVLRDMRDEHVEFGMMFKGFEKFLPLMIAGIVQSIPSMIATVLQYTMDLARLMGVGRGDADVNFFQPSPDQVFAGISGAVLILIVVLGLFGAVWSIALSFAVPLIMEHDLAVGDALITSVKAAFSNVGGLILLIILEVLVVLLGMIALCVGIFVAIPVVYAANVFAYRQVFPYFDRPDINTAPPPPDAYNFGGQTY